MSSKTSQPRASSIVQNEAEAKNALTKTRRKSADSSDGWRLATDLRRYALLARYALRGGDLLSIAKVYSLAAVPRSGAMARPPRARVRRSRRRAG